MAVESLKEILARVIQDDVDILLHKDELVSRLKDEMPGRLQMEFSPLRIAIEDLNAGEIFYKIKRAELPAQLEELRKRLIGLSLNDEKADAVVECFRYAIETNWDSANEEDYSEAIQESETYIATGLADNYAENITPDVWYCHRGHQCTGNFCGICGETRVISETPAIEEPISSHPAETVSSVPPQEPTESNYYNNSIAAIKDFGQNKKIIIAIAAIALVAIVGSLSFSTQNDEYTESKPAAKIEQSVKEEQSIKEQIKNYIFATKDDQYEYYIDPKSMLRYPPHFLADIIRVDVSKKRIFDRVVFDFTVDEGHQWFASDKMGHGEVSGGLIRDIENEVNKNRDIGKQNTKEFVDNGKMKELNSIVNDKLKKISTAIKEGKSRQETTSSITTEELMPEALQLSKDANSQKLFKEKLNAKNTQMMSSAKDVIWITLNAFKRDNDIAIEGAYYNGSDRVVDHNVDMIVDAVFYGNGKTVGQLLNIEFNQAELRSLEPKKMKKVRYIIRDGAPKVGDFSTFDIVGRVTRSK